MSQVFEDPPRWERSDDDNAPRGSARPPRGIWWFGRYMYVAQATRDLPSRVALGFAVVAFITSFVPLIGYMAAVPTALAAIIIGVVARLAQGTLAATNSVLALMAVVIGLASLVLVMAGGGSAW